MCTLFQPLYTYDQLFVLNCTATWRHPGISRGLESEFILTNERPAHEPHRPIIILPHTATNRPTIHPSIRQLLPIEAPCICICRSLKVIILDDKLNVELSAKSTDSCGHFTFRLKIQGERKISIVINATMNWKVLVSDIINQEWPVKTDKYSREVHVRRSYLEMQKWHTAREKYITHQRGRPLDFQTLESNWASPREDEIMPGKLLPPTQHWTAQTIVTFRRPLSSPGPRRPAWRCTPGLPSRTAHREAGGQQGGRQDQTRLGTEGLNRA